VRLRRGRRLPLIGCENGVRLGDNDDPRSPAINEGLHAERHAAMCQMMMTGELPYYFFNNAFWLLAAEDDNFFVDKKRQKKLCQLLISRFPGMNFAVPSGTDVDNIDYELIDLLKEAGFYHMKLGIETGNLDIEGKYVDKKIDPQDVKKKVRYMKEVGLETTGFFMLGFPYETPEQIQDTVNLATSLDLDWIYFEMVAVLPGTPLYNYCLENNLLYDDYDVTAIRYSNTFIKNPYISREELEGIRRNVWKDYMSKRINVDEYDNRGWSQDFAESQESHRGANR